MKLNVKRITILISILAILIWIRCSPPEVRTQFIMNDAQGQAVVDSLQLQIKDCEEALKAWQKTN